MGRRRRDLFIRLVTLICTIRKSPVRDFLSDLCPKLQTLAYIERRVDAGIEGGSTSVVGHRGEQWRIIGKQSGHDRRRCTRGASMSGRKTGMLRICKER